MRIYFSITQFLIFFNRKYAIASSSSSSFFCLGISVDRPSSATAIRGGARQRLQHPSTRRVHTIENTNELPVVDLSKKSSLISAISLGGNESVVDANRDQSNTQEIFPPTTPLKKFIFKKIQNGPIEVRVLLSK